MNPGYIKCSCGANIIFNYPAPRELKIIKCWCGMCYPVGELTARKTMILPDQNCGNCKHEIGPIDGAVIACFHIESIKGQFSIVSRLWIGDVCSKWEPR